MATFVYVNPNRYQSSIFVDHKARSNGGVPVTLCRAHVALGIEPNDRRLWPVLFFQRVVFGDRELERAEVEARAELLGEGRCRIVFGRVGELWEHSDDHRKVRVDISGIITLFTV